MQPVVGWGQQARSSSPVLRALCTTLVPWFDDLIPPAYRAEAEDFTMAYTPPTDCWSASACISNISNRRATI